MITAPSTTYDGILPEERLGHHRQELERVRGELWALYANLKAYQRQPNPEAVAGLQARFDAVLTQRTSFAMLNQTLKRLHGHQAELLLVLQRSDIPCAPMAGRTTSAATSNGARLAAGPAVSADDAVAMPLPA
jgi:hypothetical protein